MAAIVAENKRLSGDVSTLEEAKEKAASELRAAEEAADVMLSNNRALQGRVQKLEAEKEEVMFALGLARKRLVEAEHDLERAQVRAFACCGCALLVASC